MCRSSETMASLVPSGLISRSLLDVEIFACFCANLVCARLEWEQQMLVARGSGTALREDQIPLYMS